MHNPWLSSPTLPVPRTVGGEWEELRVPCHRGGWKEPCPPRARPGWHGMALAPPVQRVMGLMQGAEAFWGDARFLPP